VVDSGGGGIKEFMFIELVEHNDRGAYQKMNSRLERFQTAAKWVGGASTAFLILGLFSFAWFAIRNLD
jgi:hypothetical protein